MFSWPVCDPWAQGPEELKHALQLHGYLSHSHPEEHSGGADSVVSPHDYILVLPNQAVGVSHSILVMQDGGKIPSRGRWDPELRRVGSIHGNKGYPTSKAKAVAFRRLRASGYLLGMPADQVKDILMNSGRKV